MSRQSQHRLDPATEQVAEPSKQNDSPETSPDDTLSLTDQEAVFFKQYLKTGNISASVTKAFPGQHKHPQNAYRFGAKLISDNREVLELQKEKNGLTVDRIFKVINDGLNAGTFIPIKKASKPGEKTGKKSKSDTSTETVLTESERTVSLAELTKEEIAGLGGIFHPDYAIRHKYAETALKLLNLGQDKAPAVTFNQLNIGQHTNAQALIEGFTEYYKQQQNPDSKPETIEQ